MACANTKVPNLPRKSRPNEFPFACTHCSKEPRFRKEADLQKHVFIKHGIGYMPIEKKVKKVRTRSSKVSKVSHSKRRQRPQEFPEFCNSCNRRFRLPKDLQNHNNSKHGYLSEVEQQQIQDPVESLMSRISRLSTKSSPDHQSYMSSGPHLLHQTPSRTLGDPFYGRSIGSTRIYSASMPTSYQSIARRNKPVSPLDTRMTTSEMNRYVASTIEPDHAYNASCSAVVDRLVHFLQNNVPSDLRPQEVIKGGSLGKGTAVKNRSDADLVVFLSDPQYDSIVKMKKEMSRVRTVLRRYLEDHGECQITGETQFAVKVQLSCHSGYDLDVDILPTCNILATKSPEAVFREMRQKSDADKRFYSAPLVKLQMEFVERKISSVTKLRTLVRTVKFWRKTAFEESSARRLPASYPLELITIGEWEDAGRPRDFDIRKGFYRVLHALTKYQNFRKVWNDNYDRQFNMHSAPYVMDPANPFNNVMDASDSWDVVAQRAQRTISSGFSDLTGISSWL